MARDIDEVIKDLEAIIKSSGGTNTQARRDAAKLSKEALDRAKQFNKFDNQALRDKKDQLALAQKFYKSDTEQYRLLEQQIKQTNKQIEQNDKMLDIGKKLGDSFVGLGKAAFEGQGSISAFTDNIKGLGLIGQRLDVNIETFRQLSQTGANFGQSIVQLRQAAAEAALPLDDFASLVANNSKNLAALFGSTTQGARQIAELGRTVREVGVDRLAPLGFTVDEINETLLLNLESQRRTGVLNNLTAGQQRQSAIAFAEELDRLAKLTGQQRDELRSQIESAMSNERFAVALQNQTEETRQRLQAFAGTIGGISPELAEGFQDLIANSGVAVTDAARDIVQNVPQAGALINNLIAGTLTSEQALVQLRDISASSIDRFAKATVTGQVEFLRLQGGFIELGRRVTDVGSVLNEQDAAVSSLTQNLTTFEQASKVLSSQFQQVETSLLQGFGPALGGLVGGVQGLMGGLGGLAATMAKSPALTGTAIASILAGRFLFDKATQIGIVAAGVKIGNQGLGGLANMLGLKGKGGGIGRFAGAAGRALPAVGAAIGIGSSAAMLGNEETRKQGIYGLGGAAAGAAIGTIFLPGIGTLVGAGLGSMFGQFAGARQFGGNMQPGQTYLTGETGPELVTAGTSSAVTANNDLAKIFNTSELESKMSSMITQLNNANTNLANMVNGVNTLTAIEGRALKATETMARKDRNQVGLV